MTTFTRQRVETSKLPSQIVDKWSAPILSEGFVPFPKKLVRALARIYPRNEAVQELAVVLAIVDYRRPNLTRPPSLAYLSFLAGLEEEDFKAALQRLEGKGFALVGGNHEGMEVLLNGLLEAVERETAA